MQLAPLRPRRRRSSLDPTIRPSASSANRPADLSAIANRIAGLIDGPVSEALVVMLTELYGDALARIVAAIGASADGAAILTALSADPVVAGLLVVHDLHPQSLETRVAEALASFAIRPAEDAVVDRIEDDVVYLRLATEISSSEWNTIASAVIAVAPEITRVSVEIGLLQELALPA